MKQVFFYFLLSIFFLKAQTGQVIRGTVVDEESYKPILFASVVLYKDTNLIKGVYTDSLGKFKLTNIEPGRYSLEIKAAGYNPTYVDELILTAGKEKVLQIKLQEKFVKMEEVVITQVRKGDPINEMATISVREFSVRETERYPGSRGDPARMLSLFAGTQGANDTRNDIIVRGNTPAGVLWQIDGLRIPNPSHFVIPGTQGGPLSIINHKYLSNSDFYTSAFPAEYGNAISAVIDLNMRNGNTEKYEYDLQLGFLGTEAFVEGPIKKEKSSFFANYRYSTLELFNAFGISLGTDAVPKYQDAAFKVFFNNQKGTTFSVWGLGGKSGIDAVLSTQEKPDPNAVFKYGDNNRDQYFTSQTGILGTTLFKTFENDAYLKASVAVTHQSVDAYHELIYRHVNNEGFYVVDSLPPILDYTFRENKITSHIKYNKKFSSRFVFRVGTIAEMYSYTFIDSVRYYTFIGDSLGGLSPWNTRWNVRDDKVFLLQPYLQIKYYFSEKVLMTAGVSSMYYSMNKNSFSPVEPRIGLQYFVNKKNRLSFGAGLHSQTQPAYLYYYSDSTDADGNLVLYNKDMGLIKSFHLAAGYDKYIGKSVHLKTEVYYQYLFDIPVDENQETPFAIINAGVGFSRLFPGPLANKGTGRNYGIEFTLEHFFNKHFFYILTTSLYDSKYRGSDGILRNTTFNGNYVVNLASGKEFQIGKKSSVTLSIRVTRAGNKRYGDVDTLKSYAQQEIVFAYNPNYNVYRYPDYFRFDSRINFILNAKKTTHEIGLDLINLLNTKNILTVTFVPGLDPPIRHEYQLGFLPIFYYRINF